VESRKARTQRVVARAILDGVQGIAVPADDPMAKFNTRAELLQQNRGLAPPLAAGRVVCQEDPELAARYGLAAQGDVAK
jgi:hypothetical protein